MYGFQRILKFVFILQHPQIGSAYVTDGPNSPHSLEIEIVKLKFFMHNMKSYVRTQKVTFWIPDVEMMLITLTTATMVSDDDDNDHS